MIRPVIARPRTALALRMTTLALGLGAAPTSACLTPAPEVHDVSVRVASDDATCLPARVDSVRLTLLGDYTAGTLDTFELTTASGLQDLSNIRRDARSVLVSVEGPSYEATGRTSFASLLERGVLAALPARRSCTLVDPDAYTSEGAAIVAHSDGSAWVVGGEGTPRRVLHVDPRQTFSEVFPDALFNPRIGATATSLETAELGPAVLIAGGTRRTGEMAFDSYELLDSDVSQGERLGGRLAHERRDHAALATRDGGVLLVGGRTDGDGESLVDAVESIDVVRGESELGPDLHDARVAPTLLELHDGSVIVAAGRTLDGSVVTSLERIAADLGSIALLDTSLPSGAAFVPAGRDRALVAAGSTVELWRFVVEGSAVSVEREPLTRTTGITAPIGLTLAHGRVLLVGRDDARTMRAELWTPHLGSSAVLSTTRPVTQLVRLDDGTSVEIGLEGTAFRNLDEPDAWTSLDTDQLLFPVDLSSPFLDAGAPSDFDVEDASLRATRDDARLMLMPLRFEHATLSVDAEGAYRVEFAVRDGARETAVDAVDVAADGAARGPGCSLDASTEALTLVRATGVLRLVRGSASVDCTSTTRGPVALSVVAAESTRVRAIRAARR